VPVKIHVFPRQFGVGIGVGGNPEIIGLDDSGVSVSIEVEAAVWPTFVQNVQRLRGVGIVPAHLRDIADAAAESLANGGHKK